MTPSNDQDPRTDAIIGAAMEVHRQLGCGFLEAVYQEALEIELAGRGIPFRTQEQLLIRYKGQVLQATFRMDLLCYDSVVVELKAIARLSSTEEAHMINYLKVTGCSVGLLLNFGASSVQYKRIILTSKSEGNHSNPNL